MYIRSSSSNTRRNPVCIKMEALRIIPYLSLLIFGFVEASVISTHKCKVTDNACLVTVVQKILNSFIAGIPECNVEILDPLALKTLHLDLSGLQLSLTNATVRGLKNIVIDDVEWDWDKKMVKFEFHTDASIDGHYHADGKILNKPVCGDGEIKMNFKNVRISSVVYYEIMNKDEKDHVKVTKYNFNYEVKDNANFNISNLFNGNKKLSDALLKFLNENWKPVVATYGEPIIDVIAKRIVVNLNNYLKNTPIEDIIEVPHK